MRGDYTTGTSRRAKPIQLAGGRESRGNVNNTQRNASKNMKSMKLHPGLSSVDLTLLIRVQLS